jgi:hypothetical protein
MRQVPFLSVNSASFTIINPLKLSLSQSQSQSQRQSQSKSQVMTDGHRPVNNGVKLHLGPKTKFLFQK